MGGRPSVECERRGWRVNWVGCGGVVGGGMVAGTVAVTAAPAVLAGLAGYGAYAISRKLRGVKPKKLTPPQPSLEGLPETLFVEPPRND